MNIMYAVENFKEIPEHKIFGVTIGVVTNIADPKNLGRVKVKFPHRDGERESDWVRIASLMAGPQRGIYFLPEVNDEVLLAFNHGNVDEPYVIGMLWNGQDKPPESAAYQDGKVKIRKIKTTRGNEIILSDEQGKEKIEVHTPGGNSIALEDETKKITVKDGSGNNKVIIDGQGNGITVQANQENYLKSAGLLSGN